MEKSLNWKSVRLVRELLFAYPLSILFADAQSSPDRSTTTTEAPSENRQQQQQQRKNIERKRPTIRITCVGIGHENNGTRRGLTTRLTVEWRSLTPLSRQILQQELAEVVFLQLAVGLRITFTASHAPPPNCTSQRSFSGPLHSWHRIRDEVATEKAFVLTL